MRMLKPKPESSNGDHFQIPAGLREGGAAHNETEADKPHQMHKAQPRPAPARLRRRRKGEQNGQRTPLWRRGHMRPAHRAAPWP